MNENIKSGGEIEGWLAKRCKRKIYILHSADFGIATVGLIFFVYKKSIKK